MSVLWPKPPAVTGLILLGKLKQSHIRSLRKPIGLKGDSIHWVFFWLVWGPWLWSILQVSGIVSLFFFSFFVRIKSFYWEALGKGQRGGRQGDPNPLARTSLLQHHSPWKKAGIVLLKVILVISLVHYILLNSLNACWQPRTTKQMISLRNEHQKRNKGNDQLKNCEPKVVISEYHSDS